jgi:phosphotriesterase-related protein
MDTIQTVTGPIQVSELGLTLVHEHLLIGMPGWFMDALAPPFKRAEALSRAVDKLQELRAFGVKSFVDPCPMDLGRDVTFMAEVAQRSGMQIICATGAYKEDQGITYTFAVLPVEDIEQIYLRELNEGIGETGIRAGLVKVATGAHKISPYEQKLLTAGARAACKAGCPVLTHTDEASCGLEQIALLSAEGIASWWVTRMGAPTTRTIARWLSRAPTWASIASASRPWSKTTCASPR